jgi:phospholipid transport system substrate-binding protein
VLSDPALAGERNRTRRHAGIRGYAGELFDFREMARRTLGPHWNDRSGPERDEFVRLFGRVLERSYVTTIENYAGEPIVFSGQRIDGEYAVVPSKIVTARRAEISIDYKLYETPAGWAAYDVVIEGVSLVSNYRTQFDRIIRKSSFPDLIDRMRRADISVLAIRPGAVKP